MQHAASEDDAVEVGRAIARSNLFKCAVFGDDPNWGRVLAAIGTTAADFEPDRIDVAFNGVQICRDGGIGDPRELVDLSGREVTVEVNLRNGRHSAHHLDQRPDLRLRQGERGVLHMSDQSEPAGRPGRPLESALVEKASILTETLPWLETYAGKIVVIKYGGNAMVDEDLKRAFAQDIVFMKRCGVHPVVVHGGGPQISSMLDPAGHHLGVPRRPPGDQPGGDGGRPDGAGRPGRSGPGRPDQPVTAPWRSGMSGEDGGLFTAERRGTRGRRRGGRPRSGRRRGRGADRGRSQGLIDSGSVPVVASIAPDLNGVVHNVNADTAAAALAVALQAERLVVLTDVEGLYRDWPNSTDDRSPSCRPASCAS